MKKSIISLFVFLLGLGFTTTSCEDMLTPDMNRYTENFSGTDTVYFYLGILRNVQDMVEQNELLGDLRSDLVATTAYSTDSVSHIINYTRDEDGENGLLNRAAYYKVINQCNFYLAKCDTSAVKNNIQYMKKEYAQVLNIRAWAYLQLVQTYGEVPFITKPVDNADTGWETSSPEGTATADNLIALFKNDLETANRIEYTMGYPSSSSDFQTGNSSFSVPMSRMRFYSDLIMGDMYLFRGQSRADYVAAATSYYKFLEENKSTYYVSGSSASYSKATVNNKDEFTPNVTSWIGSGLSAAAFTTSENITSIPSAANSTIGRVLTTSAGIYGFKTSSTVNSGTDSDGNTGGNGTISGSYQYKMAQVQPSNAYVALNQAQVYSTTTGSSNAVEYYEGVGDARLHATAPYYEFVENTNKFKQRVITKYAPSGNIDKEGVSYGGSFKYFKSLYRTRQVYLRYAEAINRAGYPRFAFAILRNGLKADRLASLGDSLVYDDEAQTATHVYYIDSLSHLDDATVINYITVDEMRRAAEEGGTFLDFTSSDNWYNSKGIHGLGNGTLAATDTLNSYENVVAQRIIDEANRTSSLTASVKRIAKRLQNSRADEATEDPSEGDQPGEGGDGDEPAEEPNRDDYEVIEPEIVHYDEIESGKLEINAVETLIADEMALETAFEGSRMFDLIRISRHKDAAGDNGVAWLAWKIARRDKTLAPYENVNDYDASLYGTMLNTENWYIMSPTNK